ncbi:hypothetical protein ACFY19_32750 [Streptosporangium saharense]|uniref:Uncharacterized protein n=1 Tax=Streptosporangium saharense TaxID=1706840 RepID=A0A7W7QQH1_9ACTN|nr:hypothetical protein [Streptosporangium saharense]MBB4917855.1 hypothetical protein [Streptosporangium saharense]
MTVIGVLVLIVGFVVALALALADPVILSRINGQDGEGASGRHIRVPPVETGGEVVWLPGRHTGDTGHRAA